MSIRSLRQRLLFLDENSSRYMGGARFVASDGMMDTFRDVAATVLRRGGTLLPDGGSTKDPSYKPWIEFAESMGPMMMPAAMFIANLVAERYPSGPLRVLDAASHGLFGLSIAQRLPQAEMVARISMRCWRLRKEMQLPQVAWIAIHSCPVT